MTERHARPYGERSTVRLVAARTGHVWLRFTGATRCDLLRTDRISGVQIIGPGRIVRDEHRHRLSPWRRGQRTVDQIAARIKYVDPLKAAGNRITTTEVVSTRPTPTTERNI